MRVYRVQDANNLGPMHYASPIRGNVKHHKDPGEHQGYRCGKPVNVNFSGTDARFAWNSLERLHGFIKFPRGVDNAGYTVVVYDIPDIECIVWDDGQVAFWPDDAVKVDEFLYSEVSQRLRS